MPSDKKNNKKALVVDDSPDFREILTRKLESGGFEVSSAENGLAALKVLETYAPDIIFLDMDMPEMSGAETLSKIRADSKFKNLKVAFLTNLGEFQKEAIKNDERFAKELGAVAYIKKTDDLENIAELAKKLCGDQ